MTSIIYRPFNLRYIVREPSGAHGPSLRATHRTAVCNYWYIIRENGTDEHGPTPNFAARADLLACGRIEPNKVPAAHAGVKLWEAADTASRVKRPSCATAMHAVGSLPRGVDRSKWQEIIDTFCEEELKSRGMIVDWAIHFLVDEDPVIAVQPHVHFLITSRQWRSRKNAGTYQPMWLAGKSQVNELADRWYALTGLYPVS